MRLGTHEGILKYLSLLKLTLACISYVVFDILCICICIFLYLGTHVQLVGRKSEFVFNIMGTCVFVYSAPMCFCICVFGHICEVVQLGGSSWHAAELATAVPRETAGEAEAPPGNLHKFISHQIHKYTSTEGGKYKGQLSSVKVPATTGPVTKRSQRLL